MTLRDLLAGDEILMVPGAYDGMSALLVERAGFPAVFLSGASLAYARLGRPDLGLVTASELIDACGRMADRVSIPILVDADQGYGSVAALQRLVRGLERAGAAAVQIEDQVLLKPLDALNSRPLVSVGEMLGRILAAQDARTDERLLISARTDAQPSVPFEESLERAVAYVEAGADLCLVEGLSRREDAEALAAALGGRVPLIHNLLEGGPSPFSCVEDLKPYGFKVALFAGAMAQTAAFALEGMLGGLRAAGSTVDWQGRMKRAPEMAALVGAPEMVAGVKRYA
jgi:2-methylisocitrate lyase-like PEP mutase family enzyme